MNKICVFCCKTSDQKSEDIKNNSPSSEWLKKFFIFLERYLILETGPDAEFLQNFTKKKKLLACESCLKITKSFCDLYNDLKTIELLLNWRLDTLKDVLISGDGNARASSAKEEELNKFRKALVQMCTHTQRNSFPRLQLKKTAWKAEKENSVENNIPKPITSENDGISYTVNEERNEITDFSNSGEDILPLGSVSTLEDGLDLDDANDSEGEESLKGVGEREPMIQIKSEQKTEANVARPDKEPSVLTFTTVCVKTDRVETEVTGEAAREVTSTSPPPTASLTKANQSPPPRRLRSVHRCSSCSKTFSSLESLSAHKETTTCGGNNGIEKMDWTDDDSSDRDADIADNYTGEESTSDSETDNDIPFEVINSSSDGKLTEDKKKEVPNHRWKCKICTLSFPKRNDLRTHILSAHPDKQRKNSQNKPRGNHTYRFKCPGENCESIFKQTHCLLQHWKDSHKSEEDQGHLVIEILSLSVEGSSKSKRSKMVRKTKVFAKIQMPLPNDIFLCKVSSCNRPFYSKEDFAAHEKFHGGFTCGFCPVSKEFLCDLSLHEINNHGERGFRIDEKGQKTNKLKCPRCELTFQSYEQFLSHHASVHFSLQFAEHSCPVCKIFIEDFNSKGIHRLIKHLKRAHSLDDLEIPEVQIESEQMKRDFKCSFCSCTYFKRIHLKCHVARKHPEQNVTALPRIKRKDWKPHRVHRFKCPSCKKLFKELHSLRLHWRKLHAEVENQTERLHVQILSFPETCPQLFNKPKRFAKLEVVPLKPDTIVRICQEKNCRRPFYSEEDFETHSKLHGNFTCAKCPVSKGFLPELSAHEVKAHKGVQRNTIKCQRCPETFTEFASYLRHHSSVHFSLGFNEHTCPICNVYIQQAELRGWTYLFFKHLKQTHDLDSEDVSKHHGMFRCDEKDCSAYFLNNTSLFYHRKNEHRLEKAKLEEIKKARELRVCEECGKSFKDSVKLQQHRISHSGPQSWEFTCEVCAKKCPTNQKLQEHLRTHTKEKPFVCEVCGTAYAHRHNLRIHVNNKHGDVMEDIPKKVDTRNFFRRKKASEGNSTLKKETKRKKSQAKLASKNSGIKMNKRKKELKTVSVTSGDN